MDSSQESDGDYEPVIPESGISPSNGPVIPSAIFRLRRRADQVSLAGKRQRVYQDKGTLHVIDRELFAELNAMGADNHVGDDSTDDDSDNFAGGRSLHPSDLQRIEDDRMHALKAAELAHTATVTRTHTPGTRKIAKVLRQQNLTYDDVQENIQNDEEGLRWTPCVSPDIDLLHRFIGKGSDNSDCYGCSRGIGIERVDHKVIKALCDFITELASQTHLGELAVLVEEYFELNIRQKYNHNLSPGENPILPWTSASIHEHIVYHVKEASFVHSHLLGMLLEHLRIVRYRSVYKAKSTAVHSGRRLGLPDIHVIEKGHKMLMDTTKMLMFVMSKKPQEMANFNPKFNVASSYTAAVNPKLTQAPIEQTRSIYDNPDTGL